MSLPGSIACNVSGVVKSKSGGLSDCFRRSFWGVSPCLTSTLNPNFLLQYPSLISKSRFKARRGVMYRIEIPLRSSNWVSRLRIGRRTASVLPDPVGAIKSTFFPAKISGIAAVCGGVGSLIPVAANASWTGTVSLENTVCDTLYHRLVGVKWKDGLSLRSF